MTTQLDINGAMVLGAIMEHHEGKFSKQFDPLLKLTESFPACSGNILELHFNRSEHWFDFAFRVNSEHDIPLLYSKQVPPHNESTIKKGYTRLINSLHPCFYQGIKNIWFEYDFPFQADPSLFFDIQKGACFSAKKSYDAFAVTCSRFNYPFHPELYEFLIKIQENNLHVLYYGLMFSRKQRSVRMTIKGIQPQELTKTLRELGWNGDYRIISDLQTAYLQTSPMLLLSVDFNQQLGSRIGIEVFDQDANALAEKLFQNGIAGIYHTNFLKNWQGTLALSPVISNALTGMHHRNIRQLHKRINHFKFSVDKLHVDAKAYLYYCF